MWKSIGLIPRYGDVAWNVLSFWSEIAWDAVPINLLHKWCSKPSFSGLVETHQVRYQRPVIFTNKISFCFNAMQRVYLASRL